ncbi:hypothetical protein YB2330_004319 [Saitoella coloradoensis]
MVSAAALAGALLLGAGAVSAQNFSTVNLANIDIASAPNNTLFNRWRPSSRFLAPHSWMNDPCAPSYDSATGLYHMMYQWHPNHIQWGNISWGHAVSYDQVTWTDVGGWQDNKAEPLATGPNGTSDHLGVFSGSAQFLPRNQSYGLDGVNGLNITNGNASDTVMVVFYTGVDKLPTNWAKTYLNGTESQSLAISTNGGKSFTKIEDVIPQPPPHLNITGFRDPIFGQWAEMDDILHGDSSLGNYYAILGSGIKGVGPRLQFYYAPADNLTDWNYLGPLFAVSENETWSETYSGSFGYNFEVAGGFSLTELEKFGGDNETKHHYVVAGAEGGNTTLHPSNQWALWSEVQMTRSENGSAQTNILSTGVLDWGLAYAWNTFYDAPKDRRIAYGWIKEEDILRGQTAMGWQGAFALPRHLYTQVYENLRNTDGILSQRGSWRALRRTDGKWSMTTLGMQPDEDVVASLRETAEVTTFANKTVQAKNGTEKFSGLGINSTSLNIHAEIELSGTAPVGFVVRRSPDGDEQTLIKYDPVAQQLSIVRENSTLLNATYVKTYTHVAPLFLLDTYKTSNATTMEVERESLKLDIFVDNSVLEVFGNNRVAISSRIYPARIDSTGVGWWVGSGEGNVTLKNVTVWDGLKNAFPERPANSSTHLVWDSAEVTHDGLYWAGN